MNYYQIILVKIDDLIERKEYLKALQIIQKELNAPYLECQYHQSLQKKSQKIINFLQKFSQSKKENKSSSLKNKFDLELFNNIFLESENSECHLLFFSFLKLENLSFFLKTIKFYLFSKKYSSKNKTLLLLRLKDIGCENNFLVNKEHFSKIIVPSKLSSKIKDTENKIIFLIETKYLQKDLSFCKIAKSITVNFFCHFYPIIPFFEKPKVLLASIIYRTFLSLRIKKNLQDISDHFKIPIQDLRKINNFFEVYQV